VNTRREIERIKAEYDISKKNHEIIQQQELHNAEMDRKNLVTIGVIIFFSLLVIIIMLIYNRYRLKERSAFQKELNKKQNELFNILTTSQDKERKRIARDIHDQVGSLLSAAKLQLSGLEEAREHLTFDQSKKYSMAMALMDQVAEDLRDISHNLMPATLSRLGLVPALRGLIDNISESTRPTINLTVHGFENRIDESTEIHI
jgi:signal transduction histidine kinase